MALQYWEIEINGKTSKGRGKALKNALYSALQKDFADLTGDAPLTINIKPSQKGEAPEAPEKASE